MWGKCSDKAEQYSFFVKIDIIDDGIGIEKEEIPKIFGRFIGVCQWQTARSRNWLIPCKRDHSGTKGYIKVTSKRGKGSTFSVFLPIAKERNSIKTVDISETKMETLL